MKKKKYEKPQIVFEKYELSQHIADCAWELTLASKDACHANPDKDKLLGVDWTLFTESINCDVSDNVYQNYCYQNGSDSEYPVFRS